MFKRILILLIILVPVVFCAWYLLRNTPGRQVLKLRDKISVLLSTQSHDKYMSVVSEEELASRPIEKLEVRLDLARQASDEILALFPDSKHDREIRGVIAEQSGYLVEALKWYEGISRSSTYPPHIELRRARILRTLGQFGAARGAHLSVVESYPFQANFELGRLYMDFSQFDQARRHLLRAKPFATKNTEIRELNTLLVHTLNSLSEVDAERSKGSDQIERRHELELAIVEAIGAWNAGIQASGKEFVLSRIKVAELLAMKGKTGRLEAIDLLRAAGKGDHANELVPIHLTLGTLLLVSAETGDFSPDETKRLIEESEATLLRALDLDLDRASQTLANLVGFEHMAALSKRDIQALVLARTARAMLGTSQNWRLLTNGDEGRKDVLDMAGRIRAVSEATPQRTSDPIVSELGITRALATLVSGDREGAVAQLDGLIASAGDSAARVAFSAANTLARLDVDDTPLLLKLLAANSEGNSSLARMKTLVVVLHRRKMRMNATMAELKSSSSKASSKSTSEALAKISERHADLTQRIRTILEERAEIAKKPQESMILFHWSRLLVGHDFAEMMLGQARKKFPRDERVLTAYAVERIRNAESHDDPVVTYGAILDDLVLLYQSRPTNARVLELAQVATRRLDQRGASPAIDQVVGEVVPGLSKEASGQLSQALLAIFRGDWKQRIAALETFTEQRNVFFHYVLGMYWVEKAARVSKAKRDQVHSLARQHFEAGARANPRYVPIVIETLKFELDGVAAGSPMPEALLDKIRQLARAKPHNAPAQFLHALARRSERSHFFDANDGAAVVDALRRERGALKKAIRANPDYKMAYSMLAQTFVVGWKKMEDVAYLNSELFRALGSPEFDKAVTILRSAPQSTSILRQAGRYLEASKNFPAAIETFKKVFQMAPGQPSLQLVVSGYLRADDPSAADNWLREVASQETPGFDFEVASSISRAMIVRHKWAAAGGTETDRAAVEAEQIRLYRRVITRIRETGGTTSAVVLNNLAYLLSMSEDEGERKEALALVKPLQDRVISDAKDAFSTSIQDTYAWVLHKNGRHDESLKLYESITERAPNPEYRLGYAQVLFEVRRFEDAKKQVDLVSNTIRLGQDSLERKAKRLRNAIEEALRERITHTSRR